MEPRQRDRLQAIIDALERGLVERRQSVGFLEIADNIYPIRDWRRYGGVNADSPIHSHRLTAMYFPEALRGAENHQPAISGETASAAIRAGLRGGAPGPDVSLPDSAAENDNCRR